MAMRLALRLSFGAAALAAALFADLAAADETGISSPEFLSAGAAQSSGESREIRVRLLPRRSTILAAELSTKINRIPVPEGGRFKAGEVLLGLDCSVPEAMLLQAQLEESRARQAYLADQRLSGSDSSGKLGLAIAAATMRTAAAEVDVQRAVASKCTITAPFSGRVASQRVREQQYVQPGQAVLDIEDDSELEVAFPVPSRWLAWLDKHSRIEVVVEKTGNVYPAKLTRIGARVDPVKHSVKVSAIVDGRFSELTAGLDGRVRVQMPRSGRRLEFDLPLVSQPGLAVSLS